MEEYLETRFRVYRQMEPKARVFNYKNFLKTLIFLAKTGGLGFKKNFSGIYSGLKYSSFLELDKSVQYSSFLRKPEVQTKLTTCMSLQTFIIHFLDTGDLSTDTSFENSSSIF